MGHDEPPASRAAGGSPVERRLAALEETVADMTTALAALGQHLVTRRLSVVDERGRERVTATVTGGTAEVVVRLPPGPGGEGEVVLYATPADPDGGGVVPEGAAVGLHLRAGGDGVAELDAAGDGATGWRAWLTLPPDRPGGGPSGPGPAGLSGRPG